MKVGTVVALFAALAMPGSVLAGGKGNAKAGHAVYEAKCQLCHGPSGEGNAALAKMLHVAIPPLGSKQVQSQSDAQLRDAIVKGKGKMQPVAGLSASQVDDVIAFMRTLAKP